MTLEGLDEIRWKELETVEGTAAKAPTMLRKLASGDAKKASSAVQWLFTEVLHQSTPAPSAATFVPFLIELAGLAKQPARWSLLALLGDLACDGDHCSFVFTGYTAKSPLHDAVAAGHATYVKALGDKSAAARAGAAFVLAWLPEHAKASVGALRKAIAKEKDATPLASMILALAVLAKDIKPARAGLEHDERYVRAAAVAACAIVGPLPDGQRLEKLATAGSVDYLSWWHGQAGVLLIQAVLHAGTRDGDAPLLERMWLSDVGHLFGAAAIRALFPAKIEPEKLTKTQRDLLDRVTRDPVRYGQAVTLWEERGLPANARVARKHLGLATIESALDMKLTVDGATKRLADHMIDAAHDSAKHVPLARALAEGRSGEQIIHSLFETAQLDFGTSTSAGVEAMRVEIMAAAADDIVPLLLSDLTREVQREDGRLIVPTLAPTRVSALALARRGVELSDRYLERVANLCSFVDDNGVDYLGDSVVAFLRSLDADRRVPRLAQIHRNVAPWVMKGKLLLESLMVETPHPELTEALVARVKELKDAFAYGRKWENSLFSDGFPPKTMKAMKPKDHPLTPTLLEHIHAYAAAAKGSKQLEDAIAKFLVS